MIKLLTNKLIKCDVYSKISPRCLAPTYWCEELPIGVMIYAIQFIIYVMPYLYILNKL